MLSNKSTVKQRVEPTNPSDLVIDNCQTTIEPSANTVSPRYNLRSRDSQQPSAFHKLLTETHGSGDPVIPALQEHNTSGLAIAAYNSPRKVITPPIDKSNCVISPIRSSTPLPQKFDSLIQAWSADRIKSKFCNFRQINTDPVKRIVADDYIPLPDRLTTPVRILNFTNHSTPRPQIPIQHPPARYF
jgi:hypothetical protein